jgi:hypothetical protein
MGASNFWNPEGMFKHYRGFALEVKVKFTLEQST